MSSIVSGLAATGQNAQIKSDTNTLATATDRFFSVSLPQAYPVEPLPVGQTDLRVRAINFDARLPQDPTQVFVPDFIKDTPNSAALVSYRIEQPTGNVFAADDGADFTPPSDSRLNVTVANESSVSATEIIFALTMRKNRAAT